MKKLLIESEAQYYIYLEDLHRLMAEKPESGTDTMHHLYFVRNAVRDYEKVNDLERV